MLLAALLLQATAPGAADPIAPAFRGQLECHFPDVAKKSCRSLAGYARTTDGKIMNSATILLAPNPLVLMRSVAPVEVKGGAVCGVILQADIDSATFTIAGQPADETRTRTLRQAVAAAFASALNHEICTTYVADGDGLKVAGSIDGVRRPELDQPVRWVSPSEGYAVQP